MACLIRRHNGIYYIVISKKRKRVWRSLRTGNKAQAKRVLEEFEGDRRCRASLTTSSFFKDFLNIAPLSFRKKTVEMYGQSFKNFLRVCGNRPIRKISPLDVETLKHKRAQEVSPVSVNIELRSLKAAFSEAKRLRLIEDSPFEGMKQIRVPYKEAGYLSEVEFLRLLTAIDDADFKALVKFAVLTMMRRGEIANLRWADVDLTRKEIRVRSNGEFRVKSGKPRAIPMNNWVSDFLAARVRRGEYVFSNSSGHAIDGSAVSRRFKRYVHKAGLNIGIHFHSLRHTGISWLINRGVPPPFVQRIAGHSSLSVTQGYTHLEDKNLITAINGFDRVMMN